MAFWNAQRSVEQTDELVQRMVADWKITLAEAQEYVEGRGLYLRMKHLKNGDELRQYQRTKRQSAVDAAVEQP